MTRKNQHRSDALSNGQSEEQKTSPSQYGEVFALWPTQPVQQSWLFGRREWRSNPNRLLQNGTIAVVATMWNVKHASAKDYALAFYTALLDKKTLGEAAQAGRTAAKRHLDDGDPTYLAYCVYGDPQLRLRFSSK